MAARRQRDRIEPRFEAAGDEGEERDDFRLSADDRAVPSAANDRARPKARKAGKAVFEKPSGSRRSRGASGGGSGGGRRRRRRSFLGHLFRLCFMMGLVGACAVACLVAYFAIKLPQEAWAIPQRPPNVKIVSVDGTLMANRGVTGGEALALDEMSPYIPQAVIAIEDRRFYSHFGVDPIGIVRAFFQNMSAGETVQGGSTLTQQLAKNIFLNPEQTLERKIQEAVLALWLEHKFTKDQILEMYLNRVYFGSGATGVEAASRRYFNKSAKDVDLGEAALLAGLLKAPSRLSPAHDPAAAKARAEVVLQAMKEEGFIDNDEYTAAIDQKPTKSKSYWNGAENYAADLVMKHVKDLIGDVKQDVVVETTIDMGLEKTAEKSIRDTIGHANRNVTQGALVSLDGTGAIRAMVGGVDYADSQYNRAVDARRQPGSAFKPFVYETAMEFGWKPESVMIDGPVKIGNWTPENYEHEYRGPVTLAYALAHSLNTVAAKLADKVGPAEVVKTAEHMGITSNLEANASIALGTSEVSLMNLTGAYATFANGGYRATPYLINRITTTGGKVLYERGAEVPPVIVPPDIVGEMNAMLMQVVAGGTGRSAHLDKWQVAGKTGTTQDFKDAWFIGYTSNLTTGVWLGNDNGKPMKKVTGGTLPADAWHEFMVAAHKGLPPMPLPGHYTIGAPTQPLSPNANDNYDDTDMPAGGYYGDRPPQQPGDGGYYDRQRPAAPDGQYYGAEADVPIPPDEVGPARVVRRSELPPGAVLEGPVGGRRSDESLFRRIFGG